MSNQTVILERIPENGIGVYDSPIGKMYMTGRRGRLTSLYFEGQKGFCYAECGAENTAVNKDLFRAVKRWLDDYFSGRIPDFMPLIDTEGVTPFEKKVLNELLEIPYGGVVTYGEIARRINAKYPGKTSARAVGGAIGRNPICVVIPCHRVIGSNGALTGYSGGTYRKAFLLRMETKNSGVINAE